MKFSEIMAVAPAEVAVGQVDFRGQSADIYRVESTIIFEVMAAAPGVIDAWSLADDEPGKTGKLISELGKAGPVVLNKILAAGLRATVAEIEKARPNLEEQIEIISAIIEHGIPDNLVKKALAAFGKLTGKVGGLE